MVSGEGEGADLGRRLHFRHYGSGPALVILHGFLGASGNWHTLASRAFAAHFSTWALDQRNHGRSPHADRIDYPLLARDLSGFMDEQGIEQAHVLGHSMGGKVAMQFALDYPDRTDRIVVVDIAPRAYPPYHREILEALRAVDPAQAASRRDVDQALSSRIPSAPVRQFLLKNLAFDSDYQQYSWEMNLEALHAQYENLNREIEGSETFPGRALFVRGGKSQYVTPDDEDDIRSRFPSAEFATIKEAGHWVHADAPEEFARVVTDFLRSAE